MRMSLRMSRISRPRGSKTSVKAKKKKRLMIFKNPFCENFSDNFFFHTHIIFYFISLLF